MDDLAALEANLRRTWPPTENDLRLCSPDPKSEPKTIQNIFSKGTALNSTTSEPNFGRGERWRRSFSVGSHVRLQYGQIRDYGPNRPLFLHRAKYSVFGDQRSLYYKTFQTQKAFFLIFFSQLNRLKAFSTQDSSNNVAKKISPHRRTIFITLLALKTLLIHNILSRRIDTY